MRYNFPIVYGPKTVFYDLPNGTDRKLVISNRISLGILDMTVMVERKFNSPKTLPRGKFSEVKVKKKKKNVRCNGRNKLKFIWKDAMCTEIYNSGYREFDHGVTLKACE